MYNFATEMAHSLVSSDHNIIPIGNDTMASNETTTESPFSAQVRLWTDALNQAPLMTDTEDVYAMLAKTLGIIKTVAKWLTRLEEYGDTDPAVLRDMLRRLAKLVALRAHVLKIVDGYFARGPVVRYEEDRVVALIISERGQRLWKAMKAYYQCVDPLHRDEDVELADIAERAKKIVDAFGEEDDDSD